MTFTKSAAVAAIAAAAALGMSMTAANAGKKMHLHGFGPHHHHHHYKPYVHGGGLIILSTSVSPCQKWWNRYLRTGNKAYLHTYRVCMR